MFFSIHRSHLINLGHLVRVEKDGMVLMSDKERLPVSRNKKKGFMEALERYI